MPVSDRAKAGLAAFIRSVVGLNILGPRVDYLALYPAKVVAQNGDGTLELQPDDVRLPGYSKVPIRYGIPGVSATVPGGSRCLLTFAGGDPQKPIVVDWESGTALVINLNGGTVNVGTGANAKIARYDDLKPAYDAQTHIGNLGFPTGAPIVPLPTAVGASEGNVK